MKKNKLKTALLVLLTSLMFYIWYGNFQSFNQSQTEIQIENNNFNNNISPTNQQKIKYRKPKLNPFRKYSNTQATSKPKAQQNKRQTQQTIPKLSTQYILQGIISEKNRSQAIISSADGNSSIISLHETVSDWELIKIEENQIIFKNDKLYDTLHLQTIK